MFHLSFAPIQVDIPFILDVHDYWPVCFSKDLYYKHQEVCDKQNDLKCSFCLSKKSHYPFLFFIPMLTIERYFRKKNLSNAKKIICHSQFVSNILKEHGYENIVLPYPYIGPKRKSKNCKDNLFKILFVGRLEKKKGAHLILDVAKQLKNKIDFRIDIIGEGPLKSILDRRDLNVYVHGFLGKNRFEYFKQADCLLVPSLWPEPFGMVVLEAMNFGVPTLTLKNGGIAELVKTNNVGFSLNEKEIPKKIIEISKNFSIKKRIEKHCIENIKKYDKKIIFKKYEEIMKKVVKKCTIKNIMK